ncbi:MAG: LysR family transcriptional regulator [bacterium]|nr:LysR family transcriptional regulator [bacterium]MCP5071266.1 LysR family transcriptional regulator [bacterium]
MTKVRMGFYFGPDEGHKLGPGKVALLEAVEEHGSISAAARALGLAYGRAWERIHDLNECFETPVVETSARGAELTPFGAELVETFHSMETAAVKAMGRDLRRLEKQVRSH